MESENIFKLLRAVEMRERYAIVSWRRSGRLDVRQATGQLDRLLRSGRRFSKHLRVLDARAGGKTKPVAIPKIGPDIDFGRLWNQVA